MISFRDCLSHQANLAHATKMRMRVVLEVIETLTATLSQARNLFLRDQRDERELDGWFALLPELMRLLQHPPRQRSDYAAFRFGQKAILGTDDSSRASRRAIAERIVSYVRGLPSSDPASLIILDQTALLPVLPNKKQQPTSTFAQPTVFSHLPEEGEEEEEEEEQQPLQRQQRQQAKPRGQNRTTRGGKKKRGK
jgi:hypothetical protein